MRIKFGKFKGLELDQVPLDYLRWLVNTFEPCEIRNEAQRIINSSKSELNSAALEEQANEILGEKPIGLLRRGYGKRHKSR